MAESDAKKALQDAVKKLADILTKNEKGKADEKKTSSGNTSQAAQGK